MINNALRATVIAASIAVASQVGWSRDANTIAITIPLRGRLSLVQRLNRDGVALVTKHEYDKAEALFLKAYLYDPVDPFTLNNLGYIAELEGQLDRAHKFYELASEQSCNAAIDRSSAEELKGKPMRAAIDGLQDSPMRVNHLNVEAIHLLSQHRGGEALAMLNEALAIDPQNLFTLNNLGVANEAVGDYGTALKYYQQVAGRHSTDAVIITNDHGWGGRPVSEMAEASAKRLERLIANGNPNYSQAALLNRRGVAAVNQNDWSTAKQDFLQAYSADPSSAFSLNNRGYVAEMEGDLETAQFFYEKAAKAMDASTTVGVATRSNAEGKQLFSVAADSTGKVDGALEIYSEQRHRQSAPLLLIPRGGVSTDENIPQQNNTSSPAAPNQPK